VSREEAMNALIESGVELRQDDIELGKRLEQERIIKLLEDECQGDWPKVIEMSLDNMKSLIKGEQK
jgi:hypothetical protein